MPNDCFIVCVYNFCEDTITKQITSEEDVNLFFLCCLSFFEEDNPILLPDFHTDSFQPTGTASSLPQDEFFFQLPQPVTLFQPFDL